MSAARCARCSLCLLLAVHAAHYMSLHTASAAHCFCCPLCLLLTICLCQWLDKDDSGTVEEIELTTGIYLEPQQTESLQAMLGSLPPVSSSSVDLFGFGRGSLLRLTIDVSFNPFLFLSIVILPVTLSILCHSVLCCTVVLGANVLLQCLWTTRTLPGVNH